MGLNDLTDSSFTRWMILSIVQLLVQLSQTADWDNGLSTTKGTAGAAAADPPEESLSNVNNDDKNLTILCEAGPLHPPELFELLVKRRTDELRTKSVHSKFASMSLHFENFFHINEIDSTIKTHLELISVWNDPRLSFNKSCSLSGSILLEENHVHNYIWTPAISIASALNAQSPASPSKMDMISIDHTGEVHQFLTLVVQVACRLDLTYFPFDEMHCEVNLAIPSQDSAYFNLSWSRKAVTVSRRHNYLTSHSVMDWTYGHYMEDINGFRFDTLTCEIRLRRHCEYYILQAYIPNIITVLVAWLSFFLCPETATPGRVTLGISSLIAMVLQYGNVAENIPKVGYLRAIDVWMIVCVCFVFFTLAEFAFIQYLQGKTAAKINSVRRMSLAAEGKSYEWEPEWWRCVDRKCSVAYLAVFFGFCMAYFSVTLAL